MIYDDSRTDRAHLAISRETVSTALVAKRCACGKSTTAKQLAQYSKCFACKLAARVATLQPEDMDILRHMLGATNHHPRSSWGFRNEYLCNRRDIDPTQRLMNAGFIRVGSSLLQHLLYFHATADGCRLAGLSAKRTVVALGARP